MAQEGDDTLVLGGIIELSGFRKLRRDQLIVLKKIVGNYARQFSESSKNFEKLSLHMKEIHKTEKSEKYELHGMVLDNEKQYNSEVTHRNLFVALNKVCEKIKSMMKK
ncbi:MAG: hypothetical protein MAG795_00394 [Candidatus Woesearchaeota archaeon]|nr:hypothetical protein [Candidatus Woesearchaeota archaeon]